MSNKNLAITLTLLFVFIMLIALPIAAQNGSVDQDNHGRGMGMGNGRGSSRDSNRGSTEEDDTETNAVCESTEHPVAARIAEAFDVDEAVIMDYFCAGNHGFGEIVIAYRMAAATGETVDDIFELRDAGNGWGKIAKDFGIKMGDLMRNHRSSGRGSSRGSNRGS